MIHFFLGLAISLATWLGLRRLVGAWPFGRQAKARIATLLIDALPCVAGFGLFLLPTGRPILAGLTVMCLGIGMGVADRVKRAVLGEPVVFADRAELIEVVRHPRLYLAFVGTGRMVLATIAVLIAVIWVIDLEPPLWPVHLIPAVLLALVAIVIGRMLFVIPSSQPLCDRLSTAYRGSIRAATRWWIRNGSGYWRRVSSTPRSRVQSGGIASVRRRAGPGPLCPPTGQS